MALTSFIASLLRRRKASALPEGTTTTAITTTANTNSSKTVPLPTTIFEPTHSGTEFRFNNTGPTSSSSGSSFSVCSAANYEFESGRCQTVLSSSSPCSFSVDEEWKEKPQREKDSGLKAHRVFGSLANIRPCSAARMSILGDEKIQCSSPFDDINDLNLPQQKKQENGTKMDGNCFGIKKNVACVKETPAGLSTQRLTIIAPANFRMIAKKAQLPTAAGGAETRHGGLMQQRKRRATVAEAARHRRHVAPSEQLQHQWPTPIPAPQPFSYITKPWTAGGGFGSGGRGGKMRLPRHVRIQRLLDAFSNEPEDMELSETERCCICLVVRAAVRAYPCEHRVMCRRCSVLLIQALWHAGADRMHCVVCREEVFMLKPNKSDRASPAPTLDNWESQQLAPHEQQASVKNGPLTGSLPHSSGLVCVI